MLLWWWGFWSVSLGLVRSRFLVTVATEVLVCAVWWEDEEHRFGDRINALGTIRHSRWEE